MPKTAARQAEGNPVATDELIARTLRVPVPDDAPTGDGEPIARQLDVTLMRVGFKLDGALFLRLAACSPETVLGVAIPAVAAAKRLVGAHRRHNPYFINFPADVPDTVEFWLDCLRDAVEDPEAEVKLTPDGALNLLSLPRYGRYQHSYEDMLAAHERYIEQLTDRVTILRLGGTLRQESVGLYVRLAGSRTPLGAEDVALLDRLAAEHVWEALPEVPVRENRALINRYRLDLDVPLLVSDPTDVLRLARVLSGGELAAPLAEPTRLQALSRPHRRAMIRALDQTARADPWKIADVLQYDEQWKRLGERLHPHEYDAPDAQLLFAVARRETPPPVPTLASRVDRALATGEPEQAARLLAGAPGRLMRAADHLLRSADGPRSEAGVLAAIASAAPGASLRVLLALREHCDNRGGDAPRLFVPQNGRGCVVPDVRSPIPEGTLAALRAALDESIGSKLPGVSSVTIDPSAARLALPISGKNRPNGIGMLPRGSIIPVGGTSVRFFIYWKEREQRTDYDLSVQFLNADFEHAGHVSWTQLHGGGFVHSGDLTQAAKGATEFIDADLSAVDPQIAYVIPTVEVYSGESFDDVGEAFFGFMEREPKAKGRPFEPRTVRAKSDISGRGRVAMPLLFERADDGWQAKWMHLNLRGFRWGNTTENNRVTASRIARAVASRQYLTVRYLAELIPRETAAPALHIGLDDSHAPAGARTITPLDLADLV